MTSNNPLLELRRIGQSVWLDHLDRTLLRSGRLARLIRDDGLGGVTSNPRILAQAIENSDAYSNELRRLSAQTCDPLELYEKLAVHEVRTALDPFLPVYEQSQGQHGFVSIEVNPHLADDATKTVAEARRLRAAVDRPNVLIKVPATNSGLRAITELTGTGIGVNVTLLFGPQRYREVAEAYIEGLEDAERAGRPIQWISSFASFFLSRIDTLVDALLEQRRSQARDPRAVASLRGEAAIASAKLAYKIHEEMFGSERFVRLAERGARPQRLLWASTGTKNPEYSDVKYIEPLIGPDTVSTMPEATLDAYRDHGHPEIRLPKGVDDALRVFESLGSVGVAMEGVSARLEREGIDQFSDPFDRMLRHIQAFVRRSSEGPETRT